MHSGNALEYILRDFEFKPEGLEMMMEELGNVSEYEAMRQHVALVASNFAARELIKPGQLAQDLAEWRNSLQNECSAIYSRLTNAPYNLTREEANADPGLLALQAVKRGVGDAMKTRYRWAHGRRPSSSVQTRA